MKVHLITSRPTLENDIEVLREIIAIMHDNRHFLVSDWIEVAYRRRKLRKPANSWVELYKLNLECIAQADAIIAETTYENFAVGYQVAIAIQQKKPILLLRRESADKDVFVTGVEDGWVKHAGYSESTLKSIVERFLNDNDVQLKDMRFNFYIDRKIHNYLRWASFKTGKTKAEVVRELLKRDIERGS